jgi:hypothetical protein
MLLDDRVLLQIVDDPLGAKGDDGAAAGAARRGCDIDLGLGEETEGDARQSLFPIGARRQFGL